MDLLFNLAGTLIGIGVIFLSGSFAQKEQ